MSAPAQSPRFRDQDIAFANGSTGETLVFETADPVNFHQAISSRATMQTATMEGKLFRPPGDAAAAPVVVIVPSSLGVAASHLGHAESLTGLGVAAFVIDPFAPRGVTSTVANQTQYSFAASAYDVLAAVRLLAGLPGIDAGRIGAQGHSRGGSAVLSAAMRRLADPVLGPGVGLRAVFAAYPWCGEQFLDPDVGRTRVRAIIGDRDDWCLPQQVQGDLQAIRLRGGDAAWRLVEAAGHSFDRNTPPERIEDASVSSAAPTVYVANDGAFIHPVDGRPDPGLTDRDLMVYALKAGYGVRGATIGGLPGQPALFREDIVTFWRGALGLPD